MNKEMAYKALGTLGTLAIVMVALAVHQKFVAPMIAKSNGAK